MKKLISTLLAISLILSTLFTGMSLAVSAATYAPVPLQPEGEYIPYPITAYDAVSNYKGYGNHLPQYEFASIAEGGVDGSYALKIEGEGKDVESYITIGSGTNALAADTEYILEMDIKRDFEIANEDMLTYLDFGVNSAWTNKMEECYFDADVNEFETLTFAFTPHLNKDNVTGWCHLALLYNIPEGGAIYIDNIKIYQEGKENINLFDRFNKTGVARGTFDNWMKTSPVVEDKVDNSLYNSKLLSDYGITANYVSLTNEGINGSTVLKVGPTSGTKEFQCTFANEAPKYHTDSDYFASGKTIRVSFKAKKVGTVKDFRFVFYKTGAWVQHTLVGTELTDEWVKYEADITFNDADLYYHSQSDTWRSGNNRWLIAANVAADSAVYIDDIEFRGAVDDYKINVYPEGSFDEFLYAKNPVDNTALEGVTYEAYNRDIYYFISTSKDEETGEVVENHEWSNFWAPDLIPADDEVVISDAGEGVRGSYALKISGVGAERQFALKIGYDTLQPLTKYKVKFKARTSDAAGLTKFDMGISRRWKWQGNVTLAISLADENGIDVIDTNWNEFTTYITTSSDGAGTYRFVYFNYALAEGTNLYIDDIEITKADGDGVNLFPQGSFGRVSTVSEIETDAKGYFEAKEHKITSGAFATSLAKTGDYVCALGLDPETSTYGRVLFELPGLNAGKTYKVKFSALMVGEVSLFDINMKDNMAADIENGPVCKHKILSRQSLRGNTRHYSNYKVYGSENWQTYEFTFTDEYIKGNEFTWPYFEIYVKSEIGAGVLLEDVSICEIGENGIYGPNIFECAGFEAMEIAEADFSSNKFWGTDATDFSFMNNIPKNLGLYGLSTDEDTDIYDAVLSENSGFDYANTVIIETRNINVTKYEIERALELDKEIWIALNSAISKKDPETEENYIVSDYQTIVSDFANLAQGIAGDNFQGFYFDEPHYHFESNDRFAEVTEHLRTTYRKRIFAMLKHDSFTSSNVNVTVSPETFAYVTDIGYWNYQYTGMNDRINGFNEAAKSFNSNARLWIAPLLGNKTVTKENKDGSIEIIEEIDTEEEVLQIFNGMLEGVKVNDNFGGIMLYSLVDTDGYKFHKLDENGKAEYNNYRNILVSIADEFANGKVLAENLNEDGVLTVTEETKLSSLASAQTYLYLDTISVFDGETDLGIDGVLNKTGLKISVTPLTSDDIVEVKVAFKGDVNCDGSINLKDLIRMKKISSGFDAEDEQFAAAGATRAVGIQAVNMTNFRNQLVGNK